MAHEGHPLGPVRVQSYFLSALVCFLHHLSLLRKSYALLFVPKSYAGMQFLGGRFCGKRGSLREGIAITAFFTRKAYAGKEGSFKKVRRF